MSLRARATTPTASLFERLLEHPVEKPLVHVRRDAATVGNPWAEGIMKNQWERRDKVDRDMDTDNAQNSLRAIFDLLAQTNQRAISIQGALGRIQEEVEKGRLGREEILAALKMIYGNTTSSNSGIAEILTTLEDILSRARQTNGEGVEEDEEEGEEEGEDPYDPFV